MRSVRDEVAGPVIAELRKLLPKVIAINRAVKVHEDEIRDVIYTLYSKAYEQGYNDGYDDGYDDGCETSAKED